MLYPLSPLAERSIGPLHFSAMKVQLTRLRPKPKRIFYVCNRKRCERCSDECHHTADIAYALYDTHDDLVPERDGTLWERIRR